MMRSKPWWLPSLLLALVLPLAGAHNAVPAPHPDFADALWIAESSRGLKVALSDGRVLFEIPDTGRIEALIVNKEAAVLWAYGEGQLLSYDFAGRRLLAVPIDAEGADRHGRSKRAHLALNPLDGSLWLGVGQRLYHFDPTGELLQEIKLRDPVRALSFDRTRIAHAPGSGSASVDPSSPTMPRDNRENASRSDVPARSAISTTTRRSMPCGWHSRTTECVAMRPRAARSKSMRA